MLAFFTPIAIIVVACLAFEYTVRAYTERQKQAFFKSLKGN